MKPLEANRAPSHASELYQFAFSHYNEKVRWALDFKGEPRVDHALLPGFHARMTAKLSGGPTTTPLWVHEGRAVSGSAKIVREIEASYPEPPLFPEDGPACEEVERWIVWLDDEVGPAVRLALFHELLADASYAARIFTTGRGSWKAAGYRLLFPRLVPMLRREMGIDEASASRACETIQQAADRVAKASGDTGYLVGAGFTAADLTAASLFFPLYFPAELEFHLPEPISPVMQGWLARWRGHPIEHYVRTIFETHRGTREKNVCQPLGKDTPLL